MDRRSFHIFVFVVFNCFYRYYSSRRRDRDRRPRLSYGPISNGPTTVNDDGDDDDDDQGSDVDEYSVLFLSMKHRRHDAFLA